MSQPGESPARLTKEQAAIRLYTGTLSGPLSDIQETVSRSPGSHIWKHKFAAKRRLNLCPQGTFMRRPRTHACWAVVKIYEPFTEMSWRWCRFKIEAEFVKLVGGFKGFIYLNPATSKWMVHERHSGGQLGSDLNKEAAIESANTNIKETPNLTSQIDALGDTSRLRVISVEKALRSLNGF